MMSEDQYEAHEELINSMMPEISNEFDTETRRDIESLTEEYAEMGFQSHFVYLGFLQGRFCEDEDGEVEYVIHSAKNPKTGKVVRQDLYLVNDSELCQNPKEGADWNFLTTEDIAGMVADGIWFYPDAQENLDTLLEFFCIYVNENIEMGDSPKFCRGSVEIKIG